MTFNLGTKVRTKIDLPILGGMGLIKEDTVCEVIGHFEDLLIFETVFSKNLPAIRFKIMDVKQSDVKPQYKEI